MTGTGKYQINTMSIFNTVSQLKERLDQYRPLDCSIVSNLREDRIVRWTYHLNAIENNSHTLAETLMALHPVERAARVHSDFVKIYPFVYGNGRTSRLLMNLELMKAGYPAAVLPVERRFEYYRALDQDQVHGNPGPFYRLVADAVREGFRPYFEALSLPWEEES
jgi:hypothetical protein